MTRLALSGATLGAALILVYTGMMAAADGITKFIAGDMPHRSCSSCPRLWSCCSPWRGRGPTQRAPACGFGRKRL
ncbi:hypothetical protein KU6B_28710 [Mameliella alba]|uniref:hypothetical protein n=1 Tax=Mameliella alba TaxID=561184 RepID=UPI0013E44D51|nr:hypothetical protein KU6B_28710 [Mameliella alba]